MIDPYTHKVVYDTSLKVAENIKKELEKNPNFFKKDESEKERKGEEDAK